MPPGEDDVREDRHRHHRNRRNGDGNNGDAGDGGSADVGGGGGGGGPGGRERRRHRRHRRDRRERGGWTATADDAGGGDRYERDSIVLDNDIIDGGAMNGIGGGGGDDDDAAGRTGGGRAGGGAGRRRREEVGSVGAGGERSSANDDDMHESDVAIFVRSDVVIDRGMPPSGDDDRLYRLVEAAAASVLDFTDDEWTNLKMLREATVTSTAVATAAEGNAVIREYIII